MALEPVSFLVLFVVLALGAWLLSNFMAKAVALLITLCTGNTVSFRLIGIFRLKDLSIDFKKGPIASLNIGEIKGKTRESLSPVLQMKGQGLKWRFALRDVEIVFRQPQPSSSKPKKRREKKQTASGAGRGKWRLLVNAARFFQVSITDICIRTLQVPDGSFYSRELDLDIDQAGIGSTSLDIRFEIMPIHVLVRDTMADCADSGEETNGLMGGSFFSGKPADSAPPLFALEHFVTVVRLDYEREVGIVMKQLEVSCGDLAVDVSEQLLKLEVIRPEKKKEVPVEAEPSPPEPAEVVPVPDLVPAVPANKQKQKSKNTKPSRLPEKVTFSMSLIRVTSSLKAHNLSMVHQIVGIRLQFPPPPPIDSSSFPETSGAVFQTVQEDANSLPAVQLDLGDIQIGQIMDSSACITIVSIQKVSVQVALDLPQQEEDTLRVEAEVHLGGMRCSLMPTLLEPWVGAATSALKQPRKVHVGAPETPKSAPKKPPSKPRKLAWRATVSAPETRLVIFGSSQQALYRVHMSTSHLFVCNTQRGGSSLEVTGELADFQVDMADEDRPCPEEILIAGEASPTCVLKISQIAAQWGVTGITSGGEEEDRGGGAASDKLTLQLEVSEGGAYFSVPKLRAIVLNVVQLQRYLKNRKLKEGSAMGGAAPQAKKPRQRKKSGGGIKRIKFVLSRLELHMERMMVVEVGEVKEPKTVNFGCQGGRTTFTTYNEGLPRVAHLKMAEFEGLTMPKLKCQSRLEVSQITVVSELDDGQTSAQISSCNWKYHELTPDGDRLVEVKIFAAQSSEFVYRKPVAEVEFPGQVLVTSTGLELRYEHDPTLFFYQISLDVKAILHQRRRDEAASAEAMAVANAAAQALAHKSLHKQSNGDSGSSSGREPDTWQPLNRSLSGLLPSSWGGNEISPLNISPNLGSAVGGGVEDLPVSYASFIDNDVVAKHAKDVKEDSPTGLEKKNSVAKKKKAPLRVAVDIEGVRVCGALADGVEACFATQALFTEDVNVGFLLEDTNLDFNGATVFSTDSLQLSRSIVRAPGSVSSKSQRRSSAESDRSSGEKVGTSGREEEDTSERKSAEVRGKGEGQGERVEPEADGPVVWDCLIQGSGVRVIMPFRLELRAIEDAVEDTIRALKLSMKGQARHYPQQGGQSRGGEEGTGAPRKKKKGSKIGTIRMVVRDIVGEIEEEPIQGWLDQHHRMMEKERRELIVREMLLEKQAPEMVQVAYSRRPSLENDCNDGGSPGEGVGASGEVDGSEADHLSPEAARQAWIKMHTQAFRSYKAACETLSSDAGSGACTNSWQSGFSVSKERRALMFVRATTVDAELRCIEGGEEGQIQRIRELDSVSPSLNVPFSRTLGRNVDATFTGLVCQLRNYTFPLISAVTARLSGDLIFAQQATIFPRQFFQDTFVGRWRCVSMLRSISGATPPLKMYSDLNLELDCCECSYSVGYEPPLCDVSYAFSCALRKANLSPRAEGALLPHPALATSTHLLPNHPRPRSSNPTPNQPGTSGTPFFSARSSSQKQFRSRYAFFAGVPPNTVKKERSFPYWDDLRYYLHGKNRAWAKNWEIFLLATTDPYESESVMHMMADTFEVLQTEGRVFTETKGFRTTVSSGEILKLTGRGSGGSSGSKSPAPFLQAPIFQLELTMDWECESGTPLNHYLHAFPAEVVPRPQLLDPFRASAWAFGWNMRMKADPKVGSSATNAISESSEIFFNDDLELFRQDSSRRSFGRDSSSGRSLEDLLLRKSVPALFPTE